MVELIGATSKKKYSGKLRRLAVWGEKNKQTIGIITNQTSWAAHNISELYRRRWQIEIFFREIKQLVCIKSFIGTSQNAVIIKIWTALITILMLKYMKAKAKYKWHLSNLVAFIRLNLLVKIDLNVRLDKPFNDNPDPSSKTGTQGMLYE
jgi:hypothetical protein